jgi:hypothetical protein
MTVYALAAQLRRLGLPGRPPRGLLDELVAPWGLKRVGATTGWRVPCDCGRQVFRLVMTWRGWTCSQCGESFSRLEIAAARLLFGFRLAFRGRYMHRMHFKVVRLLLAQLQRPRRDFLAVQGATVVVSYDPRTGENSKPWKPLGAVGHALAGTVLDVWLAEWASPVAYRQRCLGELEAGGCGGSGGSGPRHDVNTRHAG